MPVRFMVGERNDIYRAEIFPRKPGLGLSTGELNLIPQLTIAENIFLGREFVNRFWQN